MMLRGIYSDSVTYTWRMPMCCPWKWSVMVNSLTVPPALGWFMRLVRVGCLREARNISNGMVGDFNLSYTVFIHTYCRRSDHYSAYCWFQKMLEQGTAWTLWSRTSFVDICTLRDGKNWLGLSPFSWDGGGGIGTKQIHLHFPDRWEL
jgi:pentatricopeptide repeat protein